jgi:hypothetical protein
MVHKAAIEHLVRVIPHAIENHYSKERIFVDGKIPDIVVENSRGRITEVYEVETIEKRAVSKMQGEGFKRHRIKRILVIALADGSWDEVRVLAGQAQRGDIQVEKLQLSADTQLRRLKRINKSIGRKLSDAKERKRVDEGWE